MADQPPRQAPPIKVPRLARRSVNRFEEQPASIRNAVLVLITTTTTVVLIASVVMWVFDRRDFQDFGTALWFTLQTATTVGYGDVTPTSELGRTVAGIMMVVAIAFIAITTGLITSTFVDAAQGRQRAAERERREAAEKEMLDRLDGLTERLAQIETAIASSKPPDRGS